MLFAKKFFLLLSFFLTSYLIGLFPCYADVTEKVQVCEACHGHGGNSSMPLIPSLAGQNARYLYLELRDFKENRRQNPSMTPIASTLSREDMHELATYFSQQKLIDKNFQPNTAKASLGKAKADETLCAMCHLGEFRGQNEIPKVAGQNFDYIIKTLNEFKSKERNNDAGNMTSVASTLSKEDIENLANYIAGLN